MHAWSWSTLEMEKGQRNWTRWSESQENDCKRHALSLTVTRCPVLPPTSFGVTLVFTRVQEPPGTEVHGPGPAGVLLREENHLGRVQPVTGIQLAPLQQNEAAPYRVTEKKHVCRGTHNTWAQVTRGRAHPNSVSLLPSVLAYHYYQDKGMADGDPSVISTTVRPGLLTLPAISLPTAIPHLILQECS